MAEENSDLIAPISASGFPFQTAVASAVRELGLYDVQEEIAWQQRDGSDKFLDLVAVNNRVRICIECKKTNNEKFVFLLPSGEVSAPDESQLKCLFLNQVERVYKNRRVLWGTASSGPITHNAMYCVARTANGGRLLETDAQPLVRATEAYAIDRYPKFDPGPNDLETVPCIPVLVTNAPLFVMGYDPSEVPLESGIYKAKVEQFHPVEFVRFTKEFLTSEVEARTRTVIVCQATAVGKLLRNLTAAQPILPPENMIALIG
jgi:hypothetical protein